MNKIIIVSIDSRVKWENYIEFFKFIRQEKLKQLDNIRFENDKKLIFSFGFYSLDSMLYFKDTMSQMVDSATMK